MSLGRVAFALLLAGCFEPHVITGSPCLVSADCPSSQVCSPATQTCESTATAPDAPVMTTPEVDAPNIDAAPAAPVCYGGSGLFTVCMPPPENPLAVTTAIAIDTTACTGGAIVDGVCVIAASTISIAMTGSIVASGSRPLVLLGATSITIDGAIDAASRRSPQKLGPGATSAPCTPVPSSLSAGGVGGTLGGRGGEGGDGPDGNGAVAAGVVAVTKLRAGCGGATGGMPKPGVGGAGGGAVYLLSNGTITLRGKIDASGAGGSPGVIGDRGTGGGGGSGGFVGLDAPNIVVMIGASIIANGGGGGEGSGTNLMGNPGVDGNSATNAASGGRDGSTNGGDGGSGSIGGNLSGNNAEDADSDTSGGGGGGGGAGIVRAFPSRALPSTPPAS